MSVPVIETYSTPSGVVTPSIMYTGMSLLAARSNTSTIASIHQVANTSASTFLLIRSRQPLTSVSESRLPSTKTTSQPRFSHSSTKASCMRT